MTDMLLTSDPHMTEKLRRKVSEKGQVRIPPRFQDENVESYLVPEPGTITADDVIRLYPENDVPNVEVEGEVRRVSLTSQGQVTVPSEFRDKSGILPGTEVFVEENQGFIEIGMTDDCEDADQDARDDGDSRDVAAGE